jgi:hypothetical protein
MPTTVHFTGDQSINVAEDFDQVNQQLAQNESGLFTRDRERQPRVAIYRASVAYIEEQPPASSDPMVAVS